MKRARTCTAITISLCGLAIGAIQARGQSTITTHGRETSRAVVNFRELVEKEKQKKTEIQSIATGTVMEEPYTAMPMPRPTPGINIRDDGDGDEEGEERFEGPKAVVDEKGGPKVMATLVASPSPILTFQGESDSNFTNNGGGGQTITIPPDTHGAVGPNHVMTTLNSNIRIHTKTGGTVSTTSLWTFWSSLGFTSVFDPRVIFDPYSNRWIFTSVANPNAASAAVLIGVSQTSDPTGAWNLFSVDADAANLNWADFPSIGFNKNWIAVTVNMFTNASNNFVRTNIYVFKKSDLYGNVGATHTLIQPTPAFNYFTVSPALTYDNSISDLYTIQNLNGNSGGNGFLQLSKISGAIGSETFSDIAFVSAAAPWADDPPVSNFAPQSGTPNKIQNNDSRITDLVYRNGKLWTAHTIFLPAASATHSSAQWWQISIAGGIIQRGRVDDPTGNIFYAFPSIGVNANDNALLGYSRFSANQFVSANYSYRSIADPLNTMRDDFVYKSGEASYFKDFGSGRNRWGDYSATVVDPSNDLNLWTIQEYAATPGTYGSLFSGQTFDKWGAWWAELGLQPGDAALPVELASFDLSSTNGLVSVDWRTGSEVNNAGFEVYRSSDIDPDFKILASYLNHPELAGLGTTSQGKVYHYADGDDGSLIAGQTYNYRLVDVGTDGIRKEHEPKSIRIESGINGDQVYPFKIDPVVSTSYSQQVMIPFQLPAAAPVTIELYSITGQRIAVPVEQQMYTAGRHTEAVSIAKLPTGAYIIKVSTSQQSRARSFAVVH